MHKVLKNPSHEMGFCLESSKKDLDLKSDTQKVKQLVLSVFKSATYTELVPKIALKTLKLYVHITLQKKA